MNSWNEGYFTDSAYTYGYYREQSPHFMRWCLTLKGFVAPDVDDGRHCELGIGQGLSANIHAAATAGKFFGTDFNPAHAAGARTMAAASGADANFFEDSFEEFANRDDLPQFDSITFHGIWSWVSDENREHILEIIRRHLKSGGMVYNSYNCLPGWAPNAPLRELLKLHDSYHVGGGIDERVKSALNFIEEMINAKPAYLNIAPKFVDRFEELKKHDPHYVAHEYFNDIWILPYFKDVAEQFRNYKLDFAASALPVETFSELGLTEEAREFFKKIFDPIVREQIRDYFINRQFRKDIFVRGLRRLSPYETYEKILGTRYVLTKFAADVPLKITTSVAEVNLSEEIYPPLLEFLQEENFRPKTMVEYLQRHPEKKPQELVEAVTFLVDANHVLPCQSDATVKRVKKSCDKLNAYICERAKFNEEINFLASPLTGMGVNVNRIHQLFLPAAKAGEKSADKLAAAAWEILSRQGQRMVLDGKKIEEPEENIAQLKKLAEEFLSKALPIYKALQLQ